MQVSKTTKRCSCIRIITMLLAVFFVLPDACLADKGGWHLSTEPVILTESGQRAIIGWSGETEILCLATDVSSSRETTVIEFLPLPSEPNVTLGSRETFETVEKVLAERFVRFARRRSWLAKGLGAGVDGGEPFHITFHQRLGAHDITVVKVNRPNEFADWVQEKAKELTAGQASLPDSIRKLIAKYLNEYNCPYFVFDVIEVGPNPKSIEPIIYEFKSPVVFYPLEISSTFHGKTTIDLIVFSKDRINPDPFLRSDFHVSSVAGVHAPDLRRVMPQLEELLGERAIVQAFRYAGNIRRLRGNIAVGLCRFNLAFTSMEYIKAKSSSFYKGIAVGTMCGVIIAFVFLCPMYFAAKSQKPRWGLRLLAGFFVGMPLAVVLDFVSVYIIQDMIKPGPHWIDPAIFIVCSIGMGFIIFCFQLGLRRRWYLWCLIYATLAFPATYLTHICRFVVLYGGLPRDRLLNNIEYCLIAYLIVFILLFLIARFLVWITGSRKNQRSSMSR